MNTVTTDTFVSSHLNNSVLPKSKGGIWKGWYEQFGTQHPMVLKNFKAKIGDKVKGKGRDEVGEFTIKGKVHSDGGVDFKKEYKGRHTVEYMGRMNGKQISGDWSVNGASGTFNISVRILILLIYNRKWSKNGRATTSTVVLRIP